MIEFDVLREFFLSLEVVLFKCAFQPGFFEVDSQAHQFPHKDHPLILNEEKEYHGEGVVCSVCKEPISGPSYSCTSCNFFLHKKCALGNTHMSRQGGFEHIQNTLTLLLWSSRQRIILHAILIKLNNSIKVQYLI